MRIRCLGIAEIADANANQAIAGVLRQLHALAQGQTLLLPDRTSRLAWWVRKIAPGFYARTMKRRVGAEYLKP